MKRFWNSILEPLLGVAKPKHILEIGADTGINTLKLLEYCDKHDLRFSSIDPRPLFDVAGYKSRFGTRFNLVEDLSLNVLDQFSDVDLIVEDGDHNWYTVYHELKMIEEHCRGHFPVIVFHDTVWPYGRRDMYYNPETIPLEFQQPHARLGLKYGEPGLLDEGGMNGHLDNALSEGGPRNGVRTGIEDFLSETPLKLSIRTFPLLNGFTVIFPARFKKVAQFLDSAALKDQLLLLGEENRLVGEDAWRSRLDAVNVERSKVEASLRSMAGSESVGSSLGAALQSVRASFETQASRLSDLTLQTSLLEKRTTSLAMEKAELENRLREERARAVRLQKTLKDAQLKQRLKRLVIRTVTFLGIDTHFHKALIRGRLFVSISRQNGVDVALKLTAAKIRESFRGQENAPSAEGRRQGKEIEPLRFTENEVRKHCESRLAGLATFSGMVSVIILNRDGREHLERLFTGLVATLSGVKSEIIFVDNASKDDSIQLAESFLGKLDIKFIRNADNLSFSAANNQGAHIARGEYLVFLNNDVEPLAGWIESMVSALKHHPRVGAVGAQLIYPYIETEPLAGRVQHAGVAFDFEQVVHQGDVIEFFRPYNLGVGNNPDLSFTPEHDRPLVCVTAACLLMEKKRFEEIGGFDESYVYGYEDVDLGIRLHEAGYSSLYCASAVLFHHESSTQKKQDAMVVSDRRRKNIDRLQSLWSDWLAPRYFSEKLSSFHGLVTNTPMVVAFVVTEAGVDVTAGDYFTALELSRALSGFGWESRFIARKQGDWYQIDSDVDIVVSLLDAYDFSLMRTNRKKPLTVAWARNWFERWASNKSIADASLVFASSSAAKDYLAKELRRDVHLLPIATNLDVFRPNRPAVSEYKCDYCFTGSYWFDHREIIDLLDPSSVPGHEFKIFGENWEQVEKFAPYTQGFLAYENIPDVYASTRIVIDDANRVTKGFGSVNSRVFDALAAGCLVFTNGLVGSRDLFNGLLPTFETKDELTALLNHYLGDETARKAKVEELLSLVREGHSYVHRATSIKFALRNHTRAMPRVALKVPAPRWSVAHEWGDYHMAFALAKQLELLGCYVSIQVLSEWYNEEAKAADLAIVFRGLSEYKPLHGQISYIWNISHPDKVSLAEYERFDRIFIASDYWAREIASKISKPVEVLHQCTDPEVFFPDNSAPEASRAILFVGNSRKVFRPAVKVAVDVGAPLTIFGSHWGEFVDAKLIESEHLDNNDVRKYYSTAKILLNDHWDEMRSKGFVSNRIFDALACKARLVTDDVHGIRELVGDSVVVYQSDEELKDLLSSYISNGSLPFADIERGYELVVAAHTFKHRANRFLSLLEQDMVSVVPCSN